MNKPLNSESIYSNQGNPLSGAENSSHFWNPFYVRVSKISKSEVSSLKSGLQL